MTEGKRAGEKLAKAIIRMTDLMAHFDAEDFYRGLNRVIQAEMRLRMINCEWISEPAFLKYEKHKLVEDE